MIRIELESEYGYFKANNLSESEILKFYDTDSEYIESIYVEELFNKDWSYLALALKDSSASFVARCLRKILEEDGVELNHEICDANFQELYEEYGREFVNRIGDCALVIRC